MFSGRRVSRAVSRGEPGHASHILVLTALDREGTAFFQVLKQFRKLICFRPSSSCSEHWPLLTESVGAGYYRLWLPASQLQGPH